MRKEDKLYNIQYKIEFSSPFIIASSVTDPGKYDMVSLLSDGVPYIPASSVRGRVKASIWQHCYENKYWGSYDLCDAQSKGEGKYCQPDYGKDNFSLCPLCRIFGIPGGEIKRSFDFSGAYVTKPYDQIFKNLFESTGDIYTRRARNSIDPLLRRAREDALFSSGLIDMPVGLVGNILEMPDHKRYSDDIRYFDYSLALLCLRLITEIGGNRNRGLGQCRVIPENGWKSHINKHIADWKNAIRQAERVL
ncbi:MAG: RAMP superfamily CRISPR-associated protein [Nitrospirota bacterium]|nr:RAMP superfamily CRISPR-associated protein [Nitrospirota bacterium]